MIQGHWKNMTKKTNNHTKLIENHFENIMEIKFLKKVELI